MIKQNTWTANAWKVDLTGALILDKWKRNLKKNQEDLKIVRMETVACARKLIISMENHKHRANSTFDLLSCRRTKELLKQNQTLVSCILLEKIKISQAGQWAEAFAAPFRSVVGSAGRPPRSPFVMGWKPVRVGLAARLCSTAAGIVDLRAIRSYLPARCTAPPGLQGPSYPKLTIGFILVAKIFAE